MNAGQERRGVPAGLAQAPDRGTIDRKPPPGAADRPTRKQSATCWSIEI